MKTPFRYFIIPCVIAVGLLGLSAEAAKKKKEVSRQGVATPSVTANSNLPNCTLPGIQVLTDPANDQNGNQVGGPIQQLDLLGVYFAEVGTDTNAITVTIKVQNLTGTLFPNGTWQVYMNVKDTTGTLRTIFVNMNTTDNPPNAAFNFGYNSSLNGTGNDTSQGTAGVVTGSFTTDGTITIKLNTANVISFNDISAAHQFDVDLRQPGVSLSGIHAVTTALVGVLGNGVTTTVDTATTGTTSYLTVGNGACSASPSPTPTPTPTPTGTPTPTPTPTATPTPPPSTAGMPRFFTYMSPEGVADSAGEPSIGSNWTNETVAHNTLVNGTVNNLPNGGSALYYGGFLSSMLKVTFSDCSSPAGIMWDQKPLVSASTPRAAGDPILFTDHFTGRTFACQLEGLTPAGSTIDITDNDGDSFTPSDGVVPSDVDHETIGGGHYHSPLPNPGPVYPDAIYYASHSIAEARALRSDNGGLVFSPAAAPMYSDTDCGGLHGHLKVSPADGTVYVPNFACGGTLPFHNGGVQGLIVSENNGITWNVRTIPDSSTSGVIQEPIVPGTAQTRDPSVAIATDGTVYFAYQAANGHSMVAVSHDKGMTWAPSVDVGANVVNGGPVLVGTMQAIVAGDPNRAAVTFFGTETGGNNWDCGSGNTCDYGPDFTGVWYLYVATTFDGGATWITQNITPDDPIQRGGICGGGTCRNLLDFFDATIDKEGRVLIGYDDGCVSAGCINGGNNDFTSKAAIARQAGGKRMFSAFDPVEPAIPGAPNVTGSLTNGTTATLTWPTPDNSGAPITGYNIYRKVGTGTFSLLATVTTTTYVDSTFASGDSYRVTAVNSQGESPYCSDVTPVVVIPPDPCKLPGVLAIVDNDGDAAPNLPPDSRVDVQQLFVAEPLFTPAAEKLVFTLQVAPSTAGSAPASSQWYIVWNRQGTDPSDPSDASYDRMYVEMKTDVNGVVTFDYGKFGIPLNEVPPPPPDPNANTPKSYGAPDSGTYDVATGIVRITISNSKLRTIDGGAGKYVAGTALSALNVRTYLARPDAGQKSQNNANDITPNGSYSLAGNASCATNIIPVLSVVSAKTHGSAGEFDIPLPYTGNTAPKGIECRSGGGNNSYTVVFSFVNPLVSVTGAQITSGTANIDSAHTGINQSNPHEYIVNLTGVSNAQRVTVALNGISDTAGNTASSLSATMGVLIGDTNADAFTDAIDTAQTKSQSGKPVADDNFREDVNVDGFIDAIDTALVKSKSGTALP